MTERLCKALADQGITTAFPIQALTIADALAGRDVCGKAKTGSGKTLAFGLPLLQRLAAELAATDGAVVPMTGHPARPRGPSCCCRRASSPCRSTTCWSRSPRRSACASSPSTAARTSSARCASCARAARSSSRRPGRLIDLGDRGELAVEDLDVLVLDEADRMADMGFMPQVEWVLRRVVGTPHQTLLFSATLDGAVDRLVKRYLTDPVFHEVQSRRPRPSPRWSTTSSRCTRWTR